MRHFSLGTRRALLIAGGTALTLAAQTGCSGYFRATDGYGCGYPQGYGLGYRHGYVSGDGDDALIVAGIVGGILLIDAIADGIDSCCRSQWGYGWGYRVCR